MLHVCSLSRLGETVARTGARHVVTLINTGTPVTRPSSVPAENHLFLGFNDIIEPVAGLTPPGDHHVASLLRFAERWDGEHPMVVHCFAGISRSTAGAFIIACAFAPERSEMDIARRLRAASPSATPNPRLVALADERLGRGGRMVEAITDIGRGANAFEGEPFALAIG
ncbi:tyrosine phosphatase family protein [Segnochrobactraceae bacterium EtOH-i3]